jgi:uncharacterized protein (DUF58 family)
VTTSSKKRWPLFRFLDKLFFQDWILPTNRFILLVAGGAVLPLVSNLLGLGTLLWWGYLTLLLLSSVIDLLLLPARKEWTVQRSLPEQVDVKQPFDVQLVIKTVKPYLLSIELSDDMPITFRAAPDSEPTNGLSASGQFHGKGGEFAYTTKAQERGNYLLRHVVLRYWGGLGLWKKQVRLEQQQAIQVYPDLSQVRGVLASAQNTLILEGNRLFKKQRSGSDFHYVREYMQGDEPRHINWKASARSAKLMTNLFQPEKGKIVTLLLDCGRMMGIELDGKTKLDLTLEAALTLAAVALKQGDQVSLLAFSSQMKVYVPPGKGLQHLQELTRAVYDLKNDFVESNYGVALSHLIRYQKKRAFVVLFSEMESYLYDKELAPYLHRLRRSNHLLLLSLHDPVLHDWVRIKSDTSRMAFIQSISHKFTLDRKAYIQQMAGRGIPVLDVPADQLTLSAVNAYLDLTPYT